MKRKLIKIAVIFFAVMIMFTIISRVAYNLSTAVVETIQPVRETLGPVIEAQGMVSGKQETAVITKENQLVKTVEVTTGQAVEKGQILYTLDLKELDKQMKTKNDELELVNMQIQSAQAAQQAAEASHQLQLEQVQSDYERTLWEGDAAIQAAEEELGQAQERYDQYMNDPDQFPELSQEELLQTIDDKRAAYEAAVREKDNAIYESQKAIDSASIAITKDDSSIKQNEITKAQTEAELQELQTLKDQKGIIKSPVKGVITELTLKSGMRTSGNGDVRLADASAGARITAVFPDEDEQYIQRGQEVGILSGDNISSDIKKKLEGLKIGSVTSDKGEEAGNITVIIDIPGETLDIGTSVTINISALTKTYDTCIPISALNVKEKGKYYVNVLEKKNSILGNEWVVYARDVELLFKNGKYAAVTGINSGEEIVTKSSRIIENGTHVKRKES